jgi:hypothetical protein
VVLAGRNGVVVKGDGLRRWEERVRERGHWRAAIVYVCSESGFARGAGVLRGSLRGAGE